MKIVKIVIEKTKDMISAYAENVEGIYGGGNIVNEAKESVVGSIRLYIKYNTDKNIPRILKEKYRFAYKIYS